MSNLSYVLFFLIALSSCGSSCKKDKDKWEEVLFEFEIPLSITPDTDTIAVGQELTLTANFRDSLFDFYSQKKYYLPNFDLQTVAVIQKLSNSNLSVLEQPGAVSKFTLTNKIGGFSNLSTTFADVNYVYENNHYKLTVSIIPKEAGVFIIRFYHSTGGAGSTKLPQELAPNEPGVKRFPVMRHTRYIFNAGNTHFNIYKDNCKTGDPNEATNWVESKATYTFVVK
jgi:hypothetical protein